MIYITHSQQQTINLGKKLAAKFKSGDVVLLEGELGAGKTTLTKGIAEYFGIKKNITSPTFTLLNVYKILRPKSSVLCLVHIDTYRLENEKDLVEIGVEDYLGKPNTICLIEWPEKLKTLLKNKPLIKIKIEHLKDGRKINIYNEK